MVRNVGDATKRVLNPDKRMGFGPNTAYRNNVHYTQTHFYTVYNTHRSDRYDMTVFDYRQHQNPSRDTRKP